MISVGGTFYSPQRFSRGMQTISPIQTIHIIIPNGYRQLNLYGRVELPFYRGPYLRDFTSTSRVYVEVLDGCFIHCLELNGK